MKNFRKIVLMLVACICLSISFAGCNAYQNGDNCGGIVESYEYVGEKEIKIPFTENRYYTALQLQINFCEKSNQFFPYLIIVKSFFEDYGCNTIEELFINEDFIKAYANAMVLKVNTGNAIIEINKEVATGTSVYFYEAIDEYSSVVKINNLSNYIGYFNYT